MKIAIIDYGSGNLHSVSAIFRRVLDGDDKVIVTSKADDLQDASHIILPGVGAFADCMSGLKNVPNMIETMEERVLQAGVPFLGICVGMQMLLERGFEHGEQKGLGWIKGEVIPLEPSDKSLKIPHMGWNELQPCDNAKDSLFKGIKAGEHAYFVHSYHAKLANQNEVLATVNYGDDIVAAIGHDNIYGTQFHPEKSQKTGEQLIRNFLQM